MQHLLRLHVKASNQDELLRLESLQLPPELQTLQLTGKLTGGVLKSPLLFSANVNSLVRLSLCWCDLTEDPIPYLSKLSNLTSLHLRRTYNGHQLRFHAALFPKLKGMTLQDMVEVREIYMDEGTLISLEYLKLDGLKQLAHVPDGIEFLSSLKEVYFWTLHAHFRGNLQESARMGRLNHISAMNLR